MAAADELKAAIRDEALRLGFDAVGFAPASLPPEVGERLRAFLAAGYHGGMGWLAERAAERANPAALWPEARSAIVLAVSYAPQTDPLETLPWRDRATISVYARNRDYHDVMKPRLKALARFAAARAPGAGFKVFVDTAPVAEKPLAQAAGLGWQGKHTNLLSRGLGNWFFLGVVLTTLDLPPDAPEREHCGSCTRCLDACPTGAFPRPFVLDARRCVSYLTIEHRGPIPEPLRPLIGNRIYGCDDCLAVCPWNKFAAAAREAALQPREELRAPPLAELAALDDAAFRARFRGSPIKRIGRGRFVRNVLVAIGNSGDPALLPAARALCEDADATVADAARWAVARLTAGAEGGPPARA
ncbi:MAG: tRNA epoxyqueuosine(34) reductase QueG [Acetobacteraceae bacterium]|nr:tRNA epoxyqueuosine(34) reductase QueG [Acetobacteraceae bacterium]